MVNYANFIPGEKIVAFEKWTFNSVAKEPDGQNLKLTLKNAAAKRLQRESDKKEGYAEGFLQGEAQAILMANQRHSEYIAIQGEEVRQNFLQLFANSKIEIKNSEEVIARGVLALACVLAKQLVRNEIEVNETLLMPVIKEALGLLVDDTKSKVVRLNPLDILALQAELADEAPANNLILIADPNVARGGCIVQSGSTVVNASLENRWSRLILNLGLDGPWDSSPDE